MGFGHVLFSYSQMPLNLLVACPREDQVLPAVMRQRCGHSWQCRKIGGTGTAEFIRYNLIYNQVPGNGQGGYSIIKEIRGLKVLCKKAVTITVGPVQDRKCAPFTTHWTESSVPTSRKPEMFLGSTEHGGGLK